MSAREPKSEPKHNLNSFKRVVLGNQAVSYYHIGRSRARLVTELENNLFSFFYCSFSLFFTTKLENNVKIGVELVIVVYMVR